MSLPNYLAKIKSSGIYRFVWDKSEIGGVDAETLRLVVGYSEKGPFNTPVYVQSAAEFKTIYGDISKKLEKRGVFFHRMAIQALDKGPILALNLKKFSNETVDAANFNVENFIEASPIDVKEIYDTTRFWALDPDSLQKHFDDEARRYSETVKYISLTAADSKDASNTIVMRGCSSTGYDVTLKSWFTIQGEEMPAYCEGFENLLVSDFFAEIYVFKGKFTPSLATSETLKRYFDVREGEVFLKPYVENAFGEKIDTLKALAQDENSSFISAYTGVTLPNFKSAQGSYISLDIVFNSDQARHKMMMDFNTEALDNEDIKLDQIITAGWNITGPMLSCTEKETTASVGSYSKAGWVFDDTQADCFAADVVEYPFAKGAREIVEFDYNEIRDLTPTEVAGEIHMLVENEKLTGRAFGARVAVGTACVRQGDKDTGEAMKVIIRSEGETLSASDFEIRAFAGEDPTATGKFIDYDMKDGEGEEAGMVIGYSRGASVRAGIWNFCLRTAKAGTYIVDVIGHTVATPTEGTDIELRDFEITVNDEGVTEAETINSLNAEKWNASGIIVGDRFIVDGKITTLSKIEENEDGTLSYILMGLDGEVVTEVSEKLVRYSHNAGETCRNIKPTYFKGYEMNPSTVKPASMSEHDKLLWQKNILSAIIEYPGVRLALTNRVDSEWRYLVDTFEAFIEEEVHAPLAIICKEKDNAFGHLNFPAAKTFINHGNQFTDDNGNFQVKYIAQGGNKLHNPDVNFCLASESNGASYVAYFTPLKFSDGTVATVVPSAAMVSNNFMDKYTSRLPYYIVAGPQYGRMVATGLVGPDFNYSRADLDILEPMGVNAMVYVPRKGTYINSNQTAKQNPVTALSKIHVRELCIFLQDEIENVLQSYQWEFNTQTLRDKVKEKADYICGLVKSNGGIYEFVNVCDESNNTDEVINNEMFVISTSIEPGMGCGKMVQELTLYKKGGMTSLIK